MDYKDYIYKLLGKIRAESLLNSQDEDSISCLRLNLLKTNKESFEALFPNLDKHNYVKEAYYFNKSDFRFGKSPLHNAGMYYIQDASAMMVVKLLNIKENDKVLDMCAAPGGKSTQVASYLNNTGLLLANDVNHKRALALSENIERMGIKNAVVSSESASKIANTFEGYFDKVILDAPCSGQGMFRKNEAVKDDWTYNKTLSLSALQKELILDSYKCLKRDGILVYSTCTFAREENEEVIEYLLENTNASLINIDKEKDFDEAFNISEAIRLYPDKFKGEGHFIALIRCNDDHQNRVSNYNKPASNKDIEIFRQFEKEHLNTDLQGTFIKMGDELHLLPKNTFALNNLKVLRNGLHLGKIVKNNFKPNHALALSLDKSLVKAYLNLDHESQSANDYLKGLTLTIEGKKGYNLVCVNNTPLGWTKSDGSIHKNLYPKGLRNF